jgi:hypothetical protein
MFLVHFLVFFFFQLFVTSGWVVLCGPSVYELIAFSDCIVTNPRVIRTNVRGEIVEMISMTIKNKRTLRSFCMQLQALDFVKFDRVSAHLNLYLCISKIVDCVFDVCESFNQWTVVEEICDHFLLRFFF